MAQSISEPTGIVDEAIREYRSRIGIGHVAVASFGEVDVTVGEIARLIDHTLLKPEASRDQIGEICLEATHYGFASVCVNPCWIAYCKSELGDSSVKVCTVIGFPLGATQASVKEYEAQRAIDAGAEELDMVINVGRLKSGDIDYVFADMAAVAQVAHKHDALVKVIIETFLLSEEEKVAACALAKAAELDFVKTSSGFNGGGATVEDIALMRSVVGSTMGVKAAGGIRTIEDLRNMVAAGATRIGASASVQIVNSLGVEPSSLRGEVG